MLFFKYQIVKSNRQIVDFNFTNNVWLSIAFWNSVTLFLFCFLLLCHCVTRSSQVNHFLIGIQIIRFYAYYSKRNDVSSQSTLSVLIVNRNNEQMLLMYFRFACSRDIFRCNQLCTERVLFGNTVDHFRRSWIYYSFSTVAPFSWENSRVLNV